VIHGVEGDFAILAGLTCLRVAATEKYRVVRSGGDSQGREQIDRDVESRSSRDTQGMQTIPRAAANSMKTMASTGSR